MGETTAPLDTLAEPGAPRSSHPRAFVLGLLIGAGAGGVMAVLGWFLGSASLSAVEPNAVFVNCGPALFGRPDPLPHPLCADAYAPLPSVSVLFITAGAVVAVVCLGLVVRRVLAERRRNPTA